VAHYCVNCGAALVPKLVDGRDVEACPNDSFILWHDPKVATAVVVESGDGVVLGRRAIEPGYGLWCLPGGFVNADEDPAAAAVRECMEEIGATVELTALLGVFHIPKTDAASMVGIAYRGRVADGSVPQAGVEMLEIGVFPVDALPALAFPSHRAVLDEYVRFPAKPAAGAPRRGGVTAPRGNPPSRPQGRPRSRRKR
jgi:ADP-ribose pyrophosphatase YjhB (NUDIX family)